jgi:hypothetical protein
VAPQQTLVRWRQERELLVEVLVIDLHALAQARCGIARHDQADYGVLRWMDAPAEQFFELQSCDEALNKTTKRLRWVLRSA